MLSGRERLRDLSSRLPPGLYSDAYRSQGFGILGNVEKHLLSSNRSQWKHRPPLCHPEQLTCLRQAEREMTLAIATEARPGGPALSLSNGPTAKRQPSPEGLGNQFRRGSERRRCGTISLGAKPRDMQVPSPYGPGSTNLGFFFKP